MVVASDLKRLALFLLSTAAILGSPASAKHGSGSDGTPDDDIEEKIEEEIEEDIEKRLDGKIDDKVSDRVRDKVEDKAKDRSGKGRGKDRADRKIDDKVDERMKERGGSKRADEPRAADAVGDAAIDRAKDKAKAEFEIARDAADAGRDVGRAQARRIRDAALAKPGADKDAIDAAYKAAVKAADLQRDVARDEADATYRAALNEIEGGDSGHGSNDDDVAADAGRRFEAAFDRNGDEIARGEWLALATSAEIDALSRRGHKVKSVESLGGLGVVMARMEAPIGFNLRETQKSVHADAAGAEVDYNHIFFYPSGGAIDALEGDSPSDLMRMNDRAGGEGLKIGVIDTALDSAHSALHGMHVVARDFVPYDMAKPTGHGTAVVSILAGDDGRYKGLAPKADVLAASVFFQSTGGRASATTESLVRALDWLAEMKTPIVSMSLAGPPNAILEAAIKRAGEQGVTVVAAAGNEGPAARPMYPAAYAETVAVTAVSRDKNVYRLANRGDYVDFAAPGVSVRHARDGGGYASSSGTSMAAPFVAAALAELRSGDAHDAADAYRILVENAEDLGAPGRDPVYGAGLVTPVMD